MKRMTAEERRAEAVRQGYEESVPVDPKTLTLEERRERMYRAIEATQRFLHKRAPQEEIDEIMDKVRNRFITPVQFIESSRFMLRQLGLKRLDAFYYSMIPGLTRTQRSQAKGLRPQLDRLSLMAEYVQSLYIGISVECFYLILLNNNGRLIRSELLQKGTDDSAPFYLRPLLAVAVEEDAKFIVLAHNHPRGTMRPSKEDLLCTMQTLKAVVPMKVPLLDHIIVTRHGAVSIRETGLIPDMLWRMPAQNRKIVREWLDVDLLMED